MRAYSASSEEALRSRNLLKDWGGEGFLTPQQRQSMEAETSCELLRTNIFLRVVLFLFTVIIVGAASALFFKIAISPLNSQGTTAVYLFLCAAGSYAAAEFAVWKLHLYRFGIEEALAVCAVAFVTTGLYSALYTPLGNPQMMAAKSVIIAAGAFAALWISHRFGLIYAFLAAMIFTIWLPGEWTSSATAQRLILAAIYAAALIAIATVRTRHRFTYLNEQYSIAEALLWLGIYGAIDLQLTSVSQAGNWAGHIASASEFPRPFYWATWVLTWCLPVAALTRGLRAKDRFVIAAGGIAAILTLITNKPYLGWPHHTWDPMLLGALLIGVSLGVHRWLNSGPGGRRHGYTARRLSGKDKHWIDTGALTLGVIGPPTPPGTPQPTHFGGGDSGGGGATSDF